MDEVRHVEHIETHTESAAGDGTDAGASAAHVSEAAATAVATAEAAAALAHETAAAAELDAAETIVDAEDEAEAWRVATGTRLATLSERLDSLDSREAERHATDALLLQRLERLENHPVLKESESSSNPENSTDNSPSSISERPGEIAGEGAAETVTIGPVKEAGGESLRLETEPGGQAENPPARRRHRWI
jgi:hypothetical protein